MKKILSILFILIGVNSFAQLSTIEFVENKGQWNKNIQFKAKIPSGNLYLEENELTYQFYNEQDKVRFDDLHHGSIKNPTPQDYLMNLHAFKVEFLNSNTSNIVGTEASSGYENYFIGNDKTKWASNVKKYHQTAYHNIYNNIDLKFYLRDAFLKYDFVVKKGGNTNDIQFNYKGVDGIVLEKGTIKITTSVNEIIEQKPYAYQIINGKQKEVKCKFKLEGSVVSFDFPKGYNKKYELIIDPVLVFASYSGSMFDNWGYTSTFDEAGHLYGGGVTFGVGYPITTGAYQIDFAGGNVGIYDADITISKFSPDGSSLIYSTYLGGSLGVECPHSLIVNNNNELLILGTTSSPDFPVTATAYDTSFAGGVDYIGAIPNYIGGSDIIVAKLNGSGTVLTGSTYIGGTGNDGLNLSDTLNYNYADEFRGELIIDDNDNIYVASSTLSVDFPNTGGVFQPLLGGLQDGCVFKLSADVTNLIWSSFIGGSNDDAAYSLVLNDLGEVLITGGTTSSDFLTTPSALIPNYQLGESDGWILKIDASASTIIASTFLGTDQYDQSYFIDTDSDNNVYVVGQTEGTYNIEPITVYNDSNSGQFLHKLTPDLATTVFSTTFGTGSGEIDIALSAFLVNECNYIFVSGWGGVTNIFNGGPPFSTTNGLPITANAIQSSTDGSDYYLAMFGEDADTIKYATFFGGTASNDHVDGGTSRFDKRGIVYQAVCASCGGPYNDFPTTTGAYAEATDPTISCNLGVFKLDLSNLTADADVYTTPFYCIGDTVPFQNLSNGGISYLWDFGDGDTSNLFEPIHVYDSAATYNVKLSVLDSISCILVDHDSVEIYIGGPPVATINPINGICRGDSILLNVTGGTSYEWFPKYNILNDSTDSATVWPDVTTIYTVITTDSCGFDTTEVEVVVFQKDISITPDTMICLGENVQLNVGLAISSVWSPSTGLNNANITNPLATPIVNTTYNVSIIDINGCAQDTFMEILVDVNLPDVYNPVNQAVCLGDSVQIYISGNEVNTYTWSPNTTLLTPNDSITWAKPTQTTKYYVIGENGCNTDLDSLEVVVNSAHVNVVPDLVVCQNQDFTIWATGGTDYLWTINGGTYSVDSSFSTSLTVPARYFIEITDANLCKDTASVFVNVLDAPDLEIGPDIETFWGNEVILFPITNGTSYLWSPSIGLSCDTCLSPTVTASEASTYFMTVSNSIGCLSHDTITISYSGIIYIPNSFTPNNDGDNDTFRAYGIGIVDYEISIYDRWGELLFKTENMTNGWDGTYKGKISKTETYIWKVKFTEALGASETRYGTVTLIR
ncbi:MAG: T9SS type B sorting domain-containing protein [Vicingaceae bacterium]